MPDLIAQNIEKQLGTAQVSLRRVLSAPGAAKSSLSSAPPAAARPRCCARWPASSSPTQGRSRYAAKWCSTRRRDSKFQPSSAASGLVFQSYAIWPHRSVFENVAYGLRLRHAPDAEIRQKVGARFGAARPRPARGPLCSSIVRRSATAGRARPGDRLQPAGAVAR